VTHETRAPANAAPKNVILGGVSKSSASAVKERRQPVRRGGRLQQV
jgi:hypothetical protein